MFSCQVHTQKCAYKVRIGAICALVCALGLLVPQSVLYAQFAYPFQHLTASDGLSHSTVEAIAQDELGFIWLATQDGLNRFDGYQVDIFRPLADDPNSLSSHRLTDLLVDNLGHIWVGTRDAGLDRLNPQTNQFRHFGHNPQALSSISSNKISALTLGVDGSIWVGTLDAGLNRLNPNSGLVTRFRNDPMQPESLSDDEITALMTGYDGSIWIGTAKGGINKLDPSTGEITRYQKEEGNPLGLSDNYVLALYEAPDRSLWVSTPKGLSRMQKRGAFDHYQATQNAHHKFGSGHITDMLQSVDGRFWYGVEGGGLHQLDIDEGTVSHVMERRNGRDGLNESSINCLFFDRFGILWVGSDGQGVSWFDVNRGQISLYNNDITRPITLGVAQVGSVIEDREGSVWVGTMGGGVSRFRHGTSNIEHFVHKAYDSSSISDMFATALFEDAAGTIWVGTKNGGLNRYHPQSGRFTRYRHNPNDPSSISHNTVTVMLDAPNGKLWVGTEAGLNLFDPQQGTFVRYLHDPDDGQSISGDHIVSMVGTTQGIWVGTYNSGLNYIDYTSSTIYRYGHELDDQDGMISNSILSLYLEEGASRMLWIGTDIGLQHYNPVTETFTTYSTENSNLPNNYVKGIVRDQGGFLWLSTNRGLARYDPKDKLFEAYGTEWQIQSADYEIGVAHSGRSGMLYFGGINGLNMFQYDALQENSVQPTVILRDLKLFDRSILRSSPNESANLITYAKNVALPHEASVITFEFAGLHYTYPENNEYAYKLVGFDSGWRRAGSERKATYTNLEPGEYMFQVISANSDGVWNEEGAVLQLTVRPPWYRAWWANLLYLFFFLVAAVLLVRLQIYLTRRKLELKYNQQELKRERKTNERLRELDRLKSAFLSNMSHEIRTPLTAVIGFASLLKDDFSEENKELVPLILKGGNRLLRTINSVLDLAQLESGKFYLNKQPMNLIEFVTDSVDFFRPQANKKGLGMHLILPKATLIEVELDRDILERILSNLIGNAIKFTESGQVTVGVRGINDEVRIWVKDTGVGISKSFLPYIFDKFRQESTGEARHFEGSGLGLSICKHLTELMGGAIAVESEKGKGTYFMLRFPARVTVEYDRNTRPPRPSTGSRMLSEQMSQ